MVPRLRQPLPGEPTRILSGHPLARQLVTALCFNQTGYAITNAVTGQLAGTITLPSVVSERRTSPTGASLGTTGLTASTTPGVTTTTPGWPASTDGSIVARVRWVSSDAGAFGNVCAEAATGGLYVKSGGATQLYPANASSGVFASGEWGTIAVTRAAAGTVRYYKNGVFVDQAGTGTTLGMNFNAIFNNSFSSDFNGDIELIHIWSDRILSDGEIWDQYVDPYRIYQPSLMRNGRYKPTVAAGSILRQMMQHHA